MSLGTRDRAVMPARVGAFRLKTARLGYAPIDTETKTAGAAGDKFFYVHHEREDDEASYPTHTEVAP